MTAVQSARWRPSAGGSLARGHLPRLLPERYGGGPAGVPEHLTTYGRLPPAALTPAARERLLAEIERAGLTGRGGAGFPVAAKMRAVTASRGRPVVIANGTEGEPAIGKDKVLLAREPQLVLDGAVAAAWATGARRAIVVAHGGVAEMVRDAAAHRPRAADAGVRIEVVPAAEGFVAGEASAVVNWLERGRPFPMATPPRLSERGLRGHPTLVQNVETLAHLALIVRHGARWFRSLGTLAEPGSMLVTVIGAVRCPGVHEIEVGLPVSEVLALAGGTASPLGGLLIGGYSGTWVSPAGAGQVPFSVAGLRELGASPGAGLVAALPADACGLVETARVVRYLAGESAGQCGPCRFGLADIAGETDALASGGSFQDGRLRRWLDQVEGRGACHHPDGVARLIRGALTVFAEEAACHRRGWCRGTGPPGALPVPPPGR